ncbi:MAG TPA: N-acetylglucosamine-6-phosphate deacetylase [Candidatus Acidoferrales bacterium]|jgi:N-acetylglucosamine-6-phosphate deacetylase|nr:N-acetylglucosamine-6-phosphate deacetylase [Candidatus Acidoferrales bacterium]
MTVTAIYASRILTPQEELLDTVIIVEGGRITAIGHRDEVKIPEGATDYVASGMTVVPGFVDLHIHGAGGHDVMEATPAALDCITSTVARHGTTSILATTVTAPVDETCKSLEGIAQYIRSHEQQENTGLAAEILGIHLEGPFISKARRGVHPPDSIARPSVEILDKFRVASDGLIRILTVAPEIPGALELITAAVNNGIVAAIGHTDADYEQTRAAIQAGARHAVHFYNAMRPFSHRDPGVIGAILTEPDVTAEIIADGIHVAGPAIQVLLGTKGFDTVLLASDATAATGMRDGNFRLGNIEVTVKDGVCRNSEGKLAGSTLTLDRALRYIVALGVPLIDALRMATILPARRLGLAGKKGIIAIGADADLVVLTPDLRVAGVMTRGAGLA